MAPILEFHNVARSFKRGVPVLNDVSFSMEAGEVVGLLGRNAAGKTTLIHIAIGMLFPQAGTVRLFGLSPTTDPVAVKRRIGYVAEDQILPPSSNIPELIALHRKLFPTWDTSLEKELLDRFGLAGNTQKIKQFSKGQARQAALICAVCHRPELLILDEPASGLDPAARREFLETSIQLLNREGSAILFSSHHMGDVERLGGRVVLLDQGKVLIDREIDYVRTEFCVAVFPRGSVANASTVEGLPGCLRARPMFDDWHAVFHGSCDAVRQQLRNLAGVEDAQCSRVPLEELFVALVGGDRVTAPA
jgi:ABC-2 type transport system ATP-binding protein